MPPTTALPEQLRNEKEAAVILGVTPRALQKWRFDGRGPKFVRISARCIRYRLEDILAWIEENLRNSTSE